MAHRQPAGHEYDRLRCHHCRSTDNFEAVLSGDLLGPMTPKHITAVWCKHCNANIFWKKRLTNSSATNPLYILCCDGGKVKLWTIQDPPELLATLLVNTSSRCRQFRQDIVRCNCTSCLASLRANEVTLPNKYKVKSTVLLDPCAT